MQGLSSDHMPHGHSDGFRLTVLHTTVHLNNDETKLTVHNT